MARVVFFFVVEVTDLVVTFVDWATEVSVVTVLLLFAVDETVSGIISSLAILSSLFVVFELLILFLLFDKFPFDLSIVALVVEFFDLSIIAFSFLLVVSSYYVVPLS